MSCRLKKERKMNEQIIAAAVLNVLALEDSVPDFEIIREQLIDAGYNLNISRVDKEKEFESSIRGNQYDIILADFKLPGFDAFGALRLCNAICPDVPFICISGSIGEETAIELIKLGAVDYILKDRLARLPSAIKRALDEAKEKEAKLMAEETLRKTEQQTRTFLDATSDMAFLKDDSFHHIIVNSALCEFYGKTKSEIIGKTDFELMDKKAAAECRKTDEQTLRSNDIHISEEVVGGRYYETRKFPVDLVEEKKGVGAYIRDITEHKQMEEATIRAAQEWRTTFDATVDMIWLLDSEQRILRANTTSERFFKRPCGELVGMHCWEIVHGTTEPIPECPLLQVKKSLRRETMELQIGDGWFIITVDPILNATGQYEGAVHMVRDITEHKRAEEKLKENASLLRIAGVKAKLGGWSVDLKNNLCTWSNETAVIHERPAGYAPLVEEGISYYAPEWREKITKVFTQCAQNGTPYDEEMEIITANGKRVWVRTMGEPVKDEAGKIIKVQGAFQDITERKQAEETLRESEILYRSLFENMLNGFAYFKMLFEDGQPVDLIFLEVNTAFEVQSGLKNVIGKKMSEVIPGMRESDPELIKLFATVALTGKSKRFEMYVSSLDDWYSVSAYSPQKEYFVTVFDVITERKLAEEGLCKSEASLRDAQTSAHLGNWEIDIPAQTLFWSAEMFRIFERNHSSGPPKLNEFVNIVHPDDRERINCNLMQNITEQKSYNDEYRIVRADGSVRWIAGQGKPVFDDTGNMIQFIGTAQDITERKQAEEEIKKLNEDLEQRINERTVELRESIAQLEEVNRTFVGRELKMIELKERIAELERK
jgi:PAS domain S-box-containing protein